MNSFDKMFCNVGGILIGALFVVAVNNFSHNIAFSIIAALIGNVFGVLTTAVVMATAKYIIEKHYEKKEKKDESTYR